MRDLPFAASVPLSSLTCFLRYARSSFDIGTVCEPVHTSSASRDSLSLNAAELSTLNPGIGISLSSATTLNLAADAPVSDRNPMIVENDEIVALYASISCGLNLLSTSFCIATCDCTNA